MRRLRLGRTPERARERSSARRHTRLLGAAATAVVLALTAGGCVTVHGELALLPPATEAEAARALADFTTAYNRADKANDPALSASRVTGPLGEINQAGLRARAATQPGGNTGHRPLELTDARFVLPRKAGWPRWFVADTDPDVDVDRGAGDQRWLLLFVRDGPRQPWEAAHLVILGSSQVPAFAEEGGFAVPVGADAGGLAVAPGKLGEEYVAALRKGGPGPFAAGPHTSLLRERRQGAAQRPGLVTQYLDQATDRGDFAPFGLRTKDGGAFVFFSTRSFERQTAAPGYRPKVDPDVKALLTGQVKNTVTKEWVSDQVALVRPAGGTGRKDDGVTVLARLQGVVGAQGS
ncbi:hypothetical protein ACIQCR_03710 [Streptomyces sp. NPDC093249]|uniref:hypothetical protein n=1 Tax=unclassified Streptomyces TaxID=2593676 RepID=UPI0037FB94C1